MARAFVPIVGVVDDHQRLPDAPAHLGELGRTDHRREHHVGARGGVALEARDAVVEVAMHPEGVERATIRKSGLVRAATAARMRSAATSTG